MDEVVETITEGSYTLSVVYDPEPFNPIGDFLPGVLIEPYRGYSQMEAARKVIRDHGNCFVEEIRSLNGERSYYLAPKKDKYFEGLSKAEARKNFEGMAGIVEKYVDGDTYGYIIANQDGEEVDSCWGFFGMDHVMGRGREELEAWNERDKEAEKLVRECFAL